MLGAPWRWLLLAAVVLGLALASAILFYFDPSDYGFYPICLFHRATGLLCPGCGSLRALHQLLHGNVTAAFRFNPVLMLSLPVLMCCLGVYGVRTMQGESTRLSLPAKWVWLIVGMVMAISVWRNLPGSPLALLPQ